MPEYPEEETVLISALEHYSYCPRQCALIHVEKVFDENIFTLRGRRAHEQVDVPEETEEEGKVVERALPLWSEKLGLQGKADVVEFWDDGTIFPVEYKFGKRRPKTHDDLQLCAQALCLEEMLGHRVDKGALYYHSSRRRREVVFDDALRRRTEEVIGLVRRMQIEGVLPPPANDARCENCSLIDACMPAGVEALSRKTGIPGLFVPIGEEDIRE